MTAAQPSAAAQRSPAQPSAAQRSPAQPSAAQRSPAQSRAAQGGAVQTGCPGVLPYAARHDTARHCTQLTERYDMTWHGATRALACTFRLELCKSCRVVPGAA